jgi:DNA-directed RNA polymerase specialized sigma24 family protein
MDELSYEEIATALGVGLSAIKMRIKRAREQFRRLYSGAGRLTGVTR